MVPLSYVTKPIALLITLMLAPTIMMISAVGMVLGRGIRSLRDRHGARPPGTLLPPRLPGPRSRYISNQTRQEVFIRDGGRCCECGVDDDLEFDHLLPYSLGGSNSPQNIRLLCAPCNRAKGARL